MLQQPQPVLDLFDVVGWYHSSLARPLNRSYDPTLVDLFAVDDPIVLQETHLIIVLRIIVVQCYVRNALR